MLYMEYMELHDILAKLNVELANHLANFYLTIYTLLKGGQVTS